MLSWVDDTVLFLLLVALHGDVLCRRSRRVPRLPYRQRSMVVALAGFLSGEDVVPDLVEVGEGGGHRGVLSAVRAGSGASGVEQLGPEGDRLRDQHLDAVLPYLVGEGLGQALQGELRSAVRGRSRRRTSVRPHC